MYMCEISQQGRKKYQNQLLRYIYILSLENATADTLYECITEFCVNNKINLNNMIGLGTDGANNLCGKHHSIHIVEKKQ
jgi:hypothetical protein